MAETKRSTAQQESLITRLAAENTARNAQFRLILLALPLLSALPYVPLLFRPRSRLLALLALTSLLATAYLLRHLPPTLTGIAPLDAWSRRDDVAAARRNAGVWLRQRQRRHRQGAPALDDGRSPLDLYLPYLNVGLAAVLVLLGTATDRATGSFGWVGIGNLPAIVYAVVLASKVVMGSVDPEKELSALKYQYRGA
ncbi:hypothetical protein TOPH_00862 [Tolypocladium ophioglossoides CBS 100239]|uniref:Uncharacterized protein n=1 Tax=Tolypocladium ophioglossoides (strain CBS 100239) TaxID=1163406 RepID=A0A0L0NJF1_TOLOC|nr:hypothetical protein TOPH_00862 [Tolypocladium ophioglossoides CBS 100239]